MPTCRRSRRRTGLAAVVAAVALLLVASPLRAAAPETVEEAVTLAREGKRLLDAGRPAEARAKLDRSWALNPHPKVGYLRALALVALGEPDAALRILAAIEGEPELGTYAAELPELRRRAEQARPAPLAVSVEGAGGVEVLVDGIVVGPAPYSGGLAPGPHVVAVRGRGCDGLGRPVDATPAQPVILTFRCDAGAGRIALRCDEADATVRVDGSLAGRTPLAVPVAVTPGTHTLRVEKPGFLPVERIVQVSAGETHVIELGPLLAAAAPDAGSTTWAWVTLGSGIVLTASGAGFLIKDAVDRASLRGETDTHEADRIRPTNTIIGSVSAGLGVGLVITSFFLWPDEPEDGSGFVVSPLRGGAALRYGLSF